MNPINPPPDEIFFVSYLLSDGSLTDPVVMFTGPQAAFNANTYAIAYPKYYDGSKAVVWSMAGGTVDVAPVVAEARYPSQLVRTKAPKVPS
jgi:hypothetical protein